jgi:hypothetical protein
MNSNNRFVCSTCGNYHDGLPMSYGADAPEHWYQVAPEERDSRTERTGDWCIIDNEFFFVRGCIEIPIVDGALSSWGHR